MSKQNYLISQDGTVFATDMPDCVSVIPMKADYKRNVVNTTVYSDKQMADVKIYAYDTKWVSDCNTERVNLMKLMLTSQKIKRIDKVNDDFILGVNYTLYNSSGNAVRNGETLVKAHPSTAIITSPISVANVCEYHKAMVIDACIGIPVEPTYAYGIKVPHKDHPYTLKINSVKLLSTVGEYRFNIEGTTQIDERHTHNATHCHFHIHGPQHMPSCTNNLASPFITNAKYGTTIIDSIVTSAELQIPPKYNDVEIATVDFNESESGFNEVRIDSPLREIVIEMEMLLDSISSVYDNAEIDNIIILNNQPEEEEETPVIPPEDTTPDEPEVPSDTEEPVTPPEDDTPGATPPSTGEDETEEPTDPSDTEGDNNGTTPDEGNDNPETPAPPVEDEPDVNQPSDNPDESTDVPTNPTEGNDESEGTDTTPSDNQEESTGDTTPEENTEPTI